MYGIVRKILVWLGFLFLIAFTFALTAFGVFTGRVNMGLALMFELVMVVFITLYTLKFNDVFSHN